MSPDSRTAQDSEREASYLFVLLTISKMWCDNINFDIALDQTHPGVFVSVDTT